MKRRWMGSMKRKLDNRGSALLTVILVVSFVTVLATILLYVTGMNFQIKQADYQNKKNFYTGETALEQIRANLLEDVSYASVEAYNEVLRRYVELDSPNMRKMEYNKLFVEKLVGFETGYEDDYAHAENGRWYNKAGSVGSWKPFLTSLCMEDPAQYNCKIEIDASYDTVPAGAGDGKFTTAEVVEREDTDGKIHIRGLRVTYTDDNGRTAIIYTDFDVYAPEIDWSVEGSLSTLESGVDGQKAGYRNVVDISKCVRYTNWRKE